MLQPAGSLEYEIKILNMLLRSVLDIMNSIKLQSNLYEVSIHFKTEKGFLGKGRRPHDFSLNKE